MDSPESSEPANTNSETGMPQVHDSPAFHYMSNLSPLPPVKAPLLAPGFQRVNSPPPVFSSPKPNLCSKLASLISKEVPTPSVTELPRSDGDGKNTSVDEGSDSNISVDDLIISPIQHSLVDIVNVDSVDPNFLFNSTVEKPEYSDQPPDAGSKEISVKPESKQNTRINEEIAVVPPVIVGQAEEKKVAGKAISLDDCSRLSSGPIKVGNENENFLDFAEAAYTEPVQKKAQNDREAFQYRGLHRRLQFEDVEHEARPNQPAQNPSDVEGPESLSVEIPEILINSSNTTIKIPKPSCVERKRTEKDGGLEQFNISSPNIKWATSLDSKEGERFTRCTCQRTKCLKLYCYCFAAAIYCVELCGCRECFNTAEHEDKVRATREKIKSRDPLAFAPKVVQDAIEQPASSHREDGTCFTPSSARHKRGCRCRKSACLKKYCECFEECVGCSDKCLCVGCKNTFGQKRVKSTPPLGGPNLQERVDTSKDQLLSLGSSLGQHSSSVAPMARLGETKVLRDLRFHSNSVQDDDTPEILKSTSIPLNTSKVRSPNKKRVSPHAPHEFGYSSSAGRRPRILVSPFPPLVPCADSKTFVDDQTSDPRKPSDNKRDQR